MGQIEPVFLDLSFGNGYERICVTLIDVLRKFDCDFILGVVETKHTLRFQDSSVPMLFKGERADLARNPGLNPVRVVHVIDLYGLFQAWTNLGFIGFHMKFDGGLGRAKRCPWKCRQAKIDGTGVERLKRRVEFHTKGFLGLQRPG